MTDPGKLHVAWASGLFEGEGTLGAYPKKPSGVVATASVSMCDEDVVRRFSEVMGFGTVYGPYEPSSQRGASKPYYRWTVNGFELVQATVAMLWPGLGERRKARATEVLRATRYSGRSKKGMVMPSV
jgi:hypothetical protein